MVHADKATPLVTGSVLRLYVAGNSASSRQAVQNLKRLQMLIKAEGGHVEIIDVLANPELAEKDSILATPTLCYEHSGRHRRIVGDLSDTKKILVFLGIEMKGTAA